MKLETILLILIFINLGVGAFTLGYNFKGIKSDTKEFIQIKLFSNDTNCRGMDLFMTSECLNQQFKEFFFYNASQKGKEINLTELKRDGGVCSHASKYYKDSAEELGFYGTTCIMKVYVKNDTLQQHEIAIISNIDGYVVLDQKGIVGYGKFKINSSELNNES